MFNRSKINNNLKITGVRIPHSVVLNRLRWQWETFPYSSTERIGVFKTALTFVDSVSEIWGPLLNGKKDKEKVKSVHHQFIFNLFFSFQIWPYWLFQNK